MTDIVNTDVLLWTVLVVAALVIGDYIVRTFKMEQLRRIPQIDAIIDATKSAAERGRPVHFATGGLNPTRYLYSIYTPSIMEMCKAVAKQCAELNVRFITTTAHPVADLMTRDYKTAGYVEMGHPEREVAEDHVFYPTSRSMAYGMAGLVAREKCAGNLLVGFYGACTFLPAAETGSRPEINAISVGGNVWPEEAPILMLSTDYGLITEEQAAAGAYLSGNPEVMRFLAAEDFAKITVMAAFAIAPILYAMGVRI
jgi:hypothetical protein